MIIVSVLLSIFTAVAVSTIKDAVPFARDRNAVSLANAVNSAKKSYQLRVSTAATNWSNAADDTARWLLIRDRVDYAETLTFAQFVPSGYSFALGSSLTTKVTITGPSGAVTYYSSEPENHNRQGIFTD